MAKTSEFCTLEPMSILSSCLEKSLLKDQLLGSVEQRKAVSYRPQVLVRVQNFIFLKLCRQILMRNGSDVDAIDG